MVCAKGKALFMIGGCSGSFPVVSGTVSRFDPTAPWQRRQELFSRTLYGGHTTSFLLIHHETIIIVDAGKGIKPISEYVLDMLQCEGRQEALVHHLQTHFHEDHVSGIQQDELLYQQGLIVRFYSPEMAAFHDLTRGSYAPGHPHMERVLRDYFDVSYFPVTLDLLDQIGARREHLRPFYPGAPLAIDALTVHTIPLIHPGGSIGYRFEIPGVGAVVIATDYEPSDPPDPDVVQFFDGARLLLVDIQYRRSEVLGERAIGRKKLSRVGWGHGTPETVFPILARCRQKPGLVRVVHHDPERSDADLRLFYEEMVESLGTFGLNGSFNFEMAHDGDVYWL